VIQIKTHIEHSTPLFEQSRISIEVLDNGGGIGALESTDLFTEGFSTKQSTGKGLSMVKSIVDHCRGSVVIENAEWEQGVGARVIVVLPRV
jgi:signal transduction histidine kinase